MLLATADEALGDSDIDDVADRYRVGVVLGTSIAGLEEGEQYLWRRLDGALSRPARLLVYPLYTAADALAATYDCRGPKTVISNACAAGANAIALASDQIRLGRADVMLAGGVDVLDILSFAGFSSLKALDGQACSPYSRSAGLNLGEGAALLVMERAERAVARGADILGYVIGGALSSDAHHATAPDPAGSGAVRSMSRALEQSGLDPTDIDYVNGHGTGTPANDVSEQRAFRLLFGDDNLPPYSSTKSQIGHNLGAAGAVEVAVCLLAIRHQMLPPTINVDADARAGAEADVVAGSGRPASLTTVMSNSFAFGGNNCSVVVSDRPGTRSTGSEGRVVVTGVGAVSPFGIGLDELVQGMERGVTAISSDDSLSELARSTLRAPIAGGYEKSIDPRYLRRLDQIGRLVLASARLALGEAELDINRQLSEQIGMIFGTCTGPIETVSELAVTIHERGPDRVNPKLFPNSVMNAAAGHACLSFSIRGPLSTLATGCVAGLSAVGYAADLIRDGEASAMLAIAADEFTPMLHAGFDHLGLITADRMTPYDRARSGMALGSAGACLVLESLDHARERGAHIVGEVLSTVTTADAFRIAGNNPDGRAWAESMSRAIDSAGLDVDDIGVVHGDSRGTWVIDQAEVAALAGLWPTSAPALSNLSAMTGHIHSTTPMLSLAAALVPGGRGVVKPNPSDPEPDIVRFLHAEIDPTKPALVTAANWGGTYTSTVVRPWCES